MSKGSHAPEAAETHVVAGQGRGLPGPVLMRAAPADGPGQRTEAELQDLRHGEALSRP